MDKPGSPLLHFMDIESQETFACFLPHIVYRQINQEIIIGLAHLQKRLATGDIIEKGGGIFPYAVCRRHVDRRVEQPAGPFRLAGRIGSAVEKHVVDTRYEHQVHIRFAL